MNVCYWIKNIRFANLTTIRFDLLKKEEGKANGFVYNKLTVFKAWRGDVCFFLCMYKNGANL